MFVVLGWGQCHCYCGGRNQRPLDAAYGPAGGGEEEQAGAGQPRHQEQGEQGGQGGQGGEAGRAGGRLDAALC